MLLDFMSLSDTACSTDAFFAPNCLTDKDKSANVQTHQTGRGLMAAHVIQTCTLHCPRDPLKVSGKLRQHTNTEF